MLTTLMYHRVGSGKYANSLETLESHFKYLSNFTNVIYPFEPFIKGKKNVIVTFDDATCDFYFLIFPLLKKYNIKALLAVPSFFIETSHNVPREKRLNSLKDFTFKNSPPSYSFCSYNELNEMVASNLVQIASHGHCHLDLSKDGLDLETEILFSKKNLEQRINRPISIFILPYGRYSRACYKIIKKNYKMCMRIGNSFNFNGNSFLHFRIGADGTSNLEAFVNKNKKRFLLNFIKNFFKSLFY